MNDTLGFLATIRDCWQTDGADRVTIINTLTPKARTDALKATRCLPSYPEFTDIYGAEVVGVAMTIAKRALREH